MLVICRGRIVESGPVNEVFDRSAPSPPAGAVNRLLAAHATLLRDLELNANMLAAGATFVTSIAARPAAS